MSNNEITPEQQEQLNKDLIWAASKGDIARVAKKISEGADVNYKDDHHKTPLHKAAGGLCCIANSGRRKQKREKLKRSG